MKHKVGFEEVLGTLENTLHKNCMIMNCYRTCLGEGEFEENVNMIKEYISGRYNFKDRTVLNFDTATIIGISDYNCTGVLEDTSRIEGEVICIEAYRRVCEDLLNNEYV